MDNNTKSTVKGQCCNVIMQKWKDMDLKLDLIIQYLMSPNLTKGLLKNMETLGLKMNGFKIIGSQKSNRERRLIDPLIKKMVDN